MRSRSLLPYELRIGVTGHRNAVGVAVDDAVRQLLDRIAATLADPAVPLSWVVVSPLAEGADRVVARVGLERGARLEVITPFPLDEYKNDFSGEDRIEFDGLLRRADPVIEPATPTASTADRSEDYLRAGEEVVDACEILIAIWDGRRASGKGGTAEIVRHAVRLGRMVLWIHSERPQQAIVRIVELDEPPSGELRMEKQDFPALARALSPGYAEQVAYCTDPSIEEASFHDGLHAMTATLDNAVLAARLPAGPWRDPLAPLVREHVRSDLLARHYQSLHTFIVKGIVYCAATAVTVGVAQVVFFPSSPSIISIEVLLMLAVLGLWLYGRRLASHRNWLRNRYLAERFRGAIFTTLTRAGSESGEPLPFYGGPHHWMTWTVTAMSRAAAASIPELPLEPLKDFVAAAWIDEQRVFHAGTGSRKAADAHRKHGMGIVLFAVTLIMATLHLLKVGHHLGEGLPRILRLEHWFTALALVLPVWAGSIHALMAQVELERVAERSKRMAIALAHIGARILRARTHAELRNRTESATALVHDETHEWWVLLSFQDVRLQV